MEIKTAEEKFFYTIDFQPVKYYRDLYKCINDGFKLTGMVGENLDALWDTLTGFIGWPCEIRFINISTLTKQRREELQDILFVFKQAEKTYPENIRVLLEDENYLLGYYEYIIKLAVANDDVWKIMKEANHLHEALKSGLGLSWLETSAKSIEEAIWDHLTGHLDSRPTVITIKDQAQISPKYRAEWEGIRKVLQKAAKQYPDQIKIVIEN